LSAAVQGGWLCAFAHETALPFARIETDPKVQFRPVPAAR
jgi:hypothetical protein